MIRTLLLANAKSYKRIPLRLKQFKLADHALRTSGIGALNDIARSPLPTALKKPLQVNTFPLAQRCRPNRHVRGDEGKAAGSLSRRRLCCFLAAPGVHPAKARPPRQVMSGTRRSISVETDKRPEPHHAC